MYPVAEGVKDCRKRTGVNKTAMLATPWDDLVRPGAKPHIDPCRYRQTGGNDDDGRGSSRQQRFCILYAVEPFYTSPTPRQVAIEGRLFPTATDQER